MNSLHSSPERLVVQIPCYNEADSIAATIASIPRRIEAWPALEVFVLVIDDGSLDESVARAREAGADEVLMLGRNQGLARVFQAALRRSLDRGATLIVNFDADGQYSGAEIPELIAPILEGRADFVLGARSVATLPHFSWLKQRLQVFASGLMSRVTGLPITDTTSGFRALNRSAAFHMFGQTRFTYTLESLFQVAEANLGYAEVKISARPDQRPSRLARSLFDYIRRSISTAPWLLIIYRPMIAFSLLAASFGLPGVILGARYWIWHHNQTNGHLPSLVLAAICLLMAAILMVLGLLGEALVAQRRLITEVLVRQRRVELAPLERIHD